MSVKTMAAVWNIRGLSPAERLVLLKHADHAGDDGGNSYPSVKLLADSCELSERQIQSVRRKLVAARHLIPTAYARGGHGRATVYRVVVPDIETVKQTAPFNGEVDRTLPAPNGEADCTLPESEGVERVKSGAGRVKPTSQKGEAHCTPTILNHQRGTIKEGAIRSRRTAETSLPAEWSNAPIPGELLDIAAGKGLLPEAAQHEFEKFTSHAETHDRRARNWTGAWRNWILKSKDYGNEQGNRAGAKPRARDTLMAAAARVVARRSQAD